MDSFINAIIERMILPLPGLKAQLRMVGRAVTLPPIVPSTARPSAVLCLLVPINGSWHILLMKRKEDKGAHSGQVSFPGGKYELTDANYRATALREANEEVGIMAEEVQIIGELTSLYIPVSNFNVYPYLAFCYSRPTYLLSNTEVSYIMELPITDLFHPSRKTITNIASPTSPQLIRNVNAYELEDNAIIWGATAMILSEIEALIQGL